jgi:hypothetical protein
MKEKCNKKGRYVGKNAFIEKMIKYQKSTDNSVKATANDLENP